MKKLLLVFCLIICCAFTGCSHATEENETVDTEKSESYTTPDESDIREKVPDALIGFITRYENTDDINIAKTKYEIGTIEEGEYEDYDKYGGMERKGWNVYGTYTLYRKDGSLYANKSFILRFDLSGDFKPESSAAYKK